LLNNLVYLPYYRITIWIEDKRLAQGIKHYDNSNIDWVTNHARMKAKEHYGDKILDIEAAMLSNHCSAVRSFLA
jgi:hypothetical protein